MSCLAVRTAPLNFPDLPREHLLRSFEAALKSSDCPHPRVLAIQDGHAIFVSRVKIQYTERCKIGYRVTCRIPLTDPLFQTERSVEYLYYREVVPYASFTPERYYNNDNFVINSPI